MPQVPLTNCPDCGYSLNGLPARHRCPECGFEYDEHTRVWKPAKPWILYLAALLLPVYWLADGLIRSMKDGVRLRKNAWVWNLAVVILLLLRVLLAIRSNRRGRFVAVTPEGVRARLRYGRVTVPWCQITGARVGSRVELLRVDANGAMGAPMTFVDDGHYGPLHPRKDGPAFCECIEAGLERYRDSQAADDPTSSTDMQPEPP